MYCDKCQKNKATVFIIADINGEKSKFRLCESCAKSSNMMDLPFSLLGMADNAVLSDLTEFESAAEDKIKKKTVSVPSANIFADEFQKKPYSSVRGKPAKCPVCGFAFGEIVRNLRFGCADCYKIFGQDILGDKNNDFSQPTIGFAQSDSATTKEARIEKLKSRLAAAIKKENYERAAVIRDEIKKLSQEKKSDSEPSI